MTFVRVELIGHLGRDPLLRYTRDGTAVAHLRVATDRYTTASGQPGQSRTIWHRVEVWGPLAVVLRGHAHKGERVFLSGGLDYRQWTARDGTCHHFAVIRVSGPRAFLRLLGGGVAPGSARELPDEGRASPPATAAPPAESPPPADAG